MRPGGGIRREALTLGRASAAIEVVAPAESHDEDSTNQAGVEGFWLRSHPSHGCEAFLLRRVGLVAWRLCSRPALRGDGAAAAGDALDLFLNGSWSPFLSGFGGEAVIRPGGIAITAVAPSPDLPPKVFFATEGADRDPLTAALEAAGAAAPVLAAAARGHPLCLGPLADDASAHERLEAAAVIGEVDPSGRLLATFTERAGGGDVQVRLWRLPRGVVGTAHALGWPHEWPDLVPVATACAPISGWYAPGEVFLRPPPPSELAKDVEA